MTRVSLRRSCPKKVKRPLSNRSTLSLIPLHLFLNFIHRGMTALRFRPRNSLMLFFREIPASPPRCNPENTYAIGREQEVQLCCLLAQGIFLRSRNALQGILYPSVRFNIRLCSARTSTPPLLPTGKLWEGKGFAESRCEICVMPILLQSMP